MTKEGKPQLRLLDNKEMEPEIQAGARGMGLRDVVARYMRSPGHVLAMVRFFRKLSVGELAAAAGVDAAIITSYEKGESVPTLPHLHALSGALEVNLRPLLDIFGHVKHDAAETSMGIAAMFDGDLSEGEKVDLRALVAAFATKKGQ
jgi:transcriptional regulator with XRE-family HTH domain